MSQAVLINNFAYPGPKDRFLELIKPALDLNPAVQNISTLPWNRLVSDGVFGTDAMNAQRGQLRSVYGLNTKRVDGSALLKITEMLAKLYEQTPAARGSAFALEWYSGDVVRSVPDNATVYAWRDSKAYLYVLPPSCLVSGDD